MAQNSIIVKNYLNIFEELEAAAAITPGMLVEVTSAGKVQAHSTAEGNALPMFAKENELEGEGVNDAYASGDQVQVWSPQRGDQVYAILADGNNIAIGDFLESNGAGYLQKHVADEESWDSESVAGTIKVLPDAIVAQAVEAVDLSDSSGGESSGTLGYNKRIIVRVI